MLVSYCVWWVRNNVAPHSLFISKLHCGYDMHIFMTKSFQKHQREQQTKKMGNTFTITSKAHYNTTRKALCSNNYFLGNV